MNRSLKYLLGLITLSFLVVFLRKVDFAIVLSEVLQVRWWMLAILISSLGAYILATKAWQISFGLPKAITPSLDRLFVIRQLGETMTLINPTNIVGGELSKLYMLKSAGFTSSENEASIVLSRSLIILSYIFLGIATLIISLVQFENRGVAVWMSIIAIIATMAFFGLFYFLTSHRLILYHMLKRGLSWLTGPRIEQFISGMKNLNLSMSQFYKNHREKLLWAFLYSLGHWLLGSLEFYFILTALEYDISFLDAITIEMGVMVFKSLGGFIPGQIGVEEYGNKVMLGFLGIPGLDVWVVVSILRRARQLFWIGISFVFLGLYYKSYKWKSSS